VRVESNLTLNGFKENKTKDEPRLVAFNGHHGVILSLFCPAS